MLNLEPIKDRLVSANQNFIVTENAVVAHSEGEAGEIATFVVGALNDISDLIKEVEKYRKAITNHYETYQKGYYGPYSVNWALWDLAGVSDVES